jgi:hypothetical protein
MTDRKTTTKAGNYRQKNKRKDQDRIGATEVESFEETLK